MEYHPSHKASSVTSTSSSTSSIWGSLPSLYTGRADSVSSAYEQDDLMLRDPDEGFVFQPLLSSSHKEPLEIVSRDDHETIDNDCVTFELNSKKRNSRELLTEEQKRVNHIASEKKRRNTIRGGFRELTDLVPTLKNTNNPKSTILFKSVEYIKQLEKRNSQLKNTLIMLQQKMKQRQQRKKISYHSISIPSDIVNSNTYSTPALVMPASVDDWLLNQSYSTTASFNIPAVDNDNFIVHGRESLLSSGKLNHLK